MRYINCLEAGFLHVGGGIPCQPHRAAMQLVWLTSTFVIIRDLPLTWFLLRNHWPMSLKFHLLSFLSWNTLLSREHDVGILFTWATKSYTSLLCNNVSRINTTLPTQSISLSQKHLDQRSNRPKFGVLYTNCNCFDRYTGRQYLLNNGNKILINTTGLY